MDPGFLIKLNEVISKHEEVTQPEGQNVFETDQEAKQALEDFEIGVQGLDMKAAMDLKGAFVKNYPYLEDQANEAVINAQPKMPEPEITPEVKPEVKPTKPEVKPEKVVEKPPEKPKKPEKKKEVSKPPKPEKVSETYDDSVYQAAHGFPEKVEGVKAEKVEKTIPKKEGIGLNIPPIVGEMTEAMSKSVKGLKDEISNVRYGPIEGEQGTILFDFRGDTYKAPEPTTDLGGGLSETKLIGHSEKTDQSIALDALLSKKAKPIKKPKPTPKKAAVEGIEIGDKVELPQGWANKGYTDKGRRGTPSYRIVMPDGTELRGTEHGTKWHGSKLPTKPTPKKEAWEMTRDEYRESTGADPKLVKIAERMSEVHRGKRKKPTHGEMRELVDAGFANTDNTFKTMAYVLNEKGRSLIGQRRAVFKALSEGKPVPKEVLKDYPDLKPPPSPEGTKVASEGKPKGKVYYHKEFEIKETGEKVKLKMEANQALEKVENDIFNLKALLDCLT